MSTQLRGRRSGAFWSLLFLMTITALGIGYFLGIQRAGAPFSQPATQLPPSPTWTLVQAAITTSVPTAGVAVAISATVGMATATVTPDLAAVQTVVAATLTAQPTLDQAATATSAAALLQTAVAATLTAQPTVTPTPQPTNSPTAITNGVGSNAQLIARPELVAPDPDYAIIGDVETTFAWKWTGTLAPNQGFEILFWPQGKPEDKRGIHNAEETLNMKPDADGIYRLRKKVPARDEGNYEWTIAIVMLSGYYRIVEAPSRPIKISSPGSSFDSADPREP